MILAVGMIYSIICCIYSSITQIELLADFQYFVNPPQNYF